MIFLLARAKPSWPITLRLISSIDGIRIPTDRISKNPPSKTNMKPITLISTLAILENTITRADVVVTSAPFAPNKEIPVITIKTQKTVVKANTAVFNIPTINDFLYIFSPLLPINLSYGACFVKNHIFYMRLALNFSTKVFAFS